MSAATGEKPQLLAELTPAILFQTGQAKAASKGAAPDEEAEAA